MLAADMTMQEQIVFLLNAKEMSGRAIFNFLLSRGSSISRQAVYNALAKLLEQEVLVKQGTKYSLNHVWLIRLSEFINTARRGHVYNFQELEAGEKITYRFHNLEKTSTFWMHVFQVLYNRMPAKCVVPIYSSHEWTDIVRPDQDSEWRKIVSNGSNLVLFSIGGRTIWDKEYAGKYTSDQLNIHCGKTYGFDMGYYLNIFGDYLVEVRIPESLAGVMDKLFVKHRDRVSFKSDLIASGFFDKKITLTVKRNRRLAEKLYNRISRTFFIPKEFKSPYLGFHQ